MTKKAIARRLIFYEIAGFSVMVLRGQMHVEGPPIPEGRPALDQPALLQAVEQLHDIGALHLERFAEHRLPDRSALRNDAERGQLHWPDVVPGKNMAESFALPRRSATQVIADERIDQGKIDNGLRSFASLWHSVARCAPGHAWLPKGDRPYPRVVRISIEPWRPTSGRDLQYRVL